MPSDQTRATAYLSGPEGLYALLRCPTCGGWMCHADALRDPAFRRAVEGLHLAFINFSHTDDPASAGGKVGALECDDCNRPRGNAPWTPSPEVPRARVGRLAIYRARFELMKAQREAQRRARRGE